MQLDTISPYPHNHGNGISLSQWFHHIQPLLWYHHSETCLQWNFIFQRGCPYNNMGKFTDLRCLMNTGGPLIRVSLEDRFYCKSSYWYDTIHFMIWCHSPGMMPLTWYDATHLMIWCHSLDDMMPLTQYDATLIPLTQYDTTHPIWCHSPNMMPLTQYDATHPIWCHSPNMMPLTSWY